MPHSPYLVDLSFTAVPATLKESQVLEMATVAIKEAVKPNKVLIDLFYWSPCIVYDLSGKAMQGRKYLLIQHLEQEGVKTS